jgi:hypothetical protein
MSKKPTDWDQIGANMARAYKKIRALILLSIILIILGTWKLIELITWSITH